MIIKKIKEDLSAKMRVGFDKARQKLIAETKASNSYLVVSDKNGKIKKLYAKDL